MNYKLLALDMDGTLLNDNLQISDENIHWIKQALDAGVTVIFSTGRGFVNAVEYAQQLQLETPMITVNGSEIWARPYQLLHRTLMDSIWVEQLYALTKVFPDIWYWAYTTNGIYNIKNWSELTSTLDQYQWLKFGSYTEDLDKLNAIKSEIKSWNSLEMSNSSIYNIELNAKGVSKASALEYLCQHLNIEMKQVIAMGDSLNDKKALEAVGLGVAMDNAQDEIKSIANFITSSNNDHGVAKVIQKFIFNLEV